MEYEFDVKGFSEDITNVLRKHFGSYIPENVRCSFNKDLVSSCFDFSSPVGKQAYRCVRYSFVCEWDRDEYSKF